MSLMSSGEDPSQTLTMEQCILSHDLHLPAPVSCGCALPGFHTRFCHLAAQRCTSLWDTGHRDAFPDLLPREGLQLDSVISATALSTKVQVSVRHVFVYWLVFTDFTIEKWLYLFQIFWIKLLLYLYCSRLVTITTLKDWDWTKYWNINNWQVTFIFNSNRLKDSP